MKYFKKIMNSFSYGLMWMFLIVTAGLYFKLGIVSDAPKWYNIAFYIFSLLSFLVLLRYYYRIWKT